MIEPIWDQVTGHYYGLTDAQRRALLKLPVKLNDTGNLPLSSPPPGTLKALAKRRVVTLTETGWETTPLGARLVEQLV